MEQSDISFLEDSFKRYYFKNFERIKTLTQSQHREYGFQKFSSGMIRHLSIKDDKDLHLLFVQNTPSDVYCSNAYYMFPNLPMNEKVWREADLIFDVDAKDLNLPCRATHVVSICNQCNSVSRESKQCTKCNSAKLEHRSLPCKDCINGSKNEILKLVEILTCDLGIPSKDVHLYFSGNEGFHVYVYDSQFQKIGSKERMDLVDYITLRGAIPETFGMKKNKPSRSDLPNFGQSGWKGRFSKFVFVSQAKRSKKVTELIKGGHAAFQRILDDEVAPSIGVRIDPGVTQDIHRIFRLPGSINSKSGLSKIRCSIGDLPSFNPYKDAALLSDDTAEVIADSPIEFRLKNKTFGPYSDEKVSVPTYAAVYMICKKLAKIA